MERSCYQATRTRVYACKLLVPVTAAATAVSKDFEKLQLVRRILKRGELELLRNLVLELNMHVPCSSLSDDGWYFNSWFLALSSSTYPKPIKYE
ncbi:hypothetical protein H9L39_05009 [Fusarium oxysporum f. sp. albedinis]|nr:hypothetical protein H9L39_05009 [Fusarium oxysporum f. sp. albedinis]